ncbi:MAG: hypothetical protein Q4D17_02680 [Planctomycetia bacterium]|nr:hypothetical protein [Planctomycetia bacterium]
MDYEIGDRGITCVNHETRAIRIASLLVRPCAIGQNEDGIAGLKIG